MLFLSRFRRSYIFILWITLSKSRAHHKQPCTERRYKTSKQLHSSSLSPASKFVNIQKPCRNETNIYTGFPATPPISFYYPEEKRAYFHNSRWFLLWNVLFALGKSAGDAGWARPAWPRGALPGLRPPPPLPSFAPAPSSSPTHSCHSSSRLSC